MDIFLASTCYPAGVMRVVTSLVCVLIGGFGVVSACGGDSFEPNPSTGGTGAKDGGSGTGGQAGSASGGDAGDPGQCKSNETKCNSKCTDTDTDPNNCGSCGVGCPQEPNALSTCAGGVCALECKAPFDNCDANALNGCEADTTQDAKHCGDCDTACGAPPTGATGQICDSSKCQCASNLKQCSTSSGIVCVDGSKDPQFCGDGCLKCTDGQGCNGTCFTPECPYGEQMCSDGCHNLVTDWAACGSCTTKCLFNEDCVNGQCKIKVGCPPNTTSCADNCTVTDIDPANCGACNKHCAKGQACIAGTCQLLPLAAEAWECPTGTTACALPAGWPTKPAPYYCWTSCLLGN